jgi:CRP-like cAMP-binding protein
VKLINLSLGNVMLLKNAGDTIFLKAGDLLHEEGSLFTHVFYIVSGEVRILSKGITLDKFSAGHLLGLATFLNHEQNYLYSGVVQTDTIVTAIQIDTFETLLLKNKDLRNYLLNMLCSRIEQVNDMYDFILKTTKEFIVFYELNELLCQSKQTIKTVSKKQLKEKVIVCSKTFSKALTKLKNKQIIQFDRNTITILNSKKLAELVEDMRF